MDAKLKEEMAEFLDIFDVLQYAARWMTER